jgi:lipoprotein signal peptidase
MNIMPTLAPAIRRWRPSLQTLVVVPSEPAMTAFGNIALFVALGDTLTKQLAVTYLPASGTTLGVLTERLRLLPVVNDQAAFGVGLGPYTWEINLALTLATIALVMTVCRELAAIDAWAPRILGLIAGAAGGNAISLLVSPTGVPDFIAFTTSRGTEVVMNFADIAAYLGVALTGRLAYSLIRAIRAQRAMIRSARR